MESLFFGTSALSLYGVYCPPRPDRTRSEGVVICYPFGQEYMRAHRPLRQLALGLADNGYPVLRFDYRGTGDSSEDMEGVSIEDWVADVSTAVEELRDVAGLEKVALIGLRLGGLVATLAASRLSHISRLILWDPIVNGADYLQVLRQGLPIQAIGANESRFIDESGAIHTDGFKLPVHFQTSLEPTALTEMSPPAVESLLLLTSHPEKSFDQLAASWTNAPNFVQQLQPAPYDWNYQDNFGSILLPQPILLAIKAHFG